MKIRSATPQDEAAIVALWQACGLTVPHNDPAADFRFALSKPNSDVLVLDDLSGSVMVGHDGHRGWLYYVAVASDRRRKGLGRALVEAAEAWLKQRGVPKAQLMVRETNQVVAAFYQRLGYDLMPRISMQKWLKPLTKS
jgi:ribosomal protein S18 acetylase RimI-like enzyme